MPFCAHNENTGEKMLTKTKPNVINYQTTINDLIGKHVYFDFFLNIIIVLCMCFVCAMDTIVHIFTAEQ